MVVIIKRSPPMPKRPGHSGGLAARKLKMHDCRYCGALREQPCDSQEDSRRCKHKAEGAKAEMEA